MIRLARDTLANGGAGQFSSREQDLRTFLGSFNFNGDMVKQAVGTMSGGEKARLVLCMIVWQRPNLLLLDEPTNHLDLATREALSMALNEFEGTVMLVSHDRALLRAVCDEFWLVTRGGVEPFDGDLDDYQRYLLEEGKRLRDNLKDAGKEAKISLQQAMPTPPVTPKRPVSDKAKPLQQALGKIDKALTRLQADKSRLEAQLSAGASASEIAEAGEQLLRVDLELTQLEEEWLNLSDDIEAMS